jgi:hypothetical protein
MCAVATDENTRHKASILTRFEKPGNGEKFHFNVIWMIKIFGLR